MKITNKQLNLFQPGSLSFVFSVEENGSRGFGVSVDCGLELEIQSSSLNSNIPNFQNFKLSEVPNSKKSKTSSNRPTVFYNSQKVKIAPLEMAFDYLNLLALDLCDLQLNFTAKVPLGGGFGMSSATTALFLKMVFEILNPSSKDLFFFQNSSKILKSKFQKEDYKKLVYKFEKESGTGLGDIVYQENQGFQIRNQPSSSFLSSSIILQEKSSQNSSKILNQTENFNNSKIPQNSGKIYYKVFNLKSSSSVLKNPDWKKKINQAYQEFQKELESDLTLKMNSNNSKKLVKNLFKLSWKFAKKTELASPKITQEIQKLAQKNIQASMIMIGDGVAFFSDKSREELELDETFEELSIF